MNQKLIIGLVALISSVVSSAALAQNYPDRPVKIVVPYSAGGTADFSARQMAQKLTEQTKQSFFVENKVGASGTIATNYVAKAAPVGHTVSNLCFTPDSKSILMTESSSGHILISPIPN